MQVRGQIQVVADTISGAYLNIKQDAATYRIFLPRTPDQPEPDLSLFSVGDRLEVTGSAFQYGSRPPYNRGFELLASGPAAVTILSKRSLVSAWTLLAALVLVLLGALAFWSRDHRMRVARERMRKIYSLGEEILGASSAEAILKRIEEAAASRSGCDAGAPLYAQSRRQDAGLRPRRERGARIHFA